MLPEHYTLVHLSPVYVSHAVLTVHHVLTADQSAGTDLQQLPCAQQ